MLIDSDQFTTFNPITYSPCNYACCFCANIFSPVFSFTLQKLKQPVKRQGILKCPIWHHKWLFSCTKRPVISWEITADRNTYSHWKHCSIRIWYKHWTFKAQPSNLMQHLHSFINLDPHQFRGPHLFRSCILDFQLDLFDLLQAKSATEPIEVLDTVIVLHQHYLDPAGIAPLLLLRRINVSNTMLKAAVHIWKMVT